MAKQLLWLEANWFKPGNTDLPLIAKNGKNH